MKKVITIAATILLFSCNNSGNKTDKSSGNENSNAPATSNSGETISSGSAESEISVTLTGGTNAGTYHVMSKETTCSEGLTGENSFGNQYSEKGKADNELSSLQLIIDDKNAAKNGTSKFSISIGFGKLLNGKTYSISTLEKSSGSGKATLTESGSTKTVVVEGKTADGVGISATLVCNKIMTINGIR